jgi:hypothetical protein
MAALVRIASNLRAIFAAHVAFEFVDRRCLRPSHDIQRDGLMCVAAKASDLEITITRIECVTKRGRGLGRALITEHAVVRGYAGKPVGLLAYVLRLLRGGSDRLP